MLHICNGKNANNEERPLTRNPNVGVSYSAKREPFCGRIEIRWFFKKILMIIIKSKMKKFKEPFSNH